jgi:DNA transformation protein
MAVSESYTTFIEEQLSKFEGAVMKKMFGGIGIFKEGTMFAMISAKERFYLRTDELTQSKFEAKGMGPFNHSKKGKGMPYYEVPAEILEDVDKMAQWAEEAYTTALRNKKK